MFDKKESPIAVLFGNYNDLIKNVGSGYGNKDRVALTGNFNLKFYLTIGLWATHNLLLSYNQQLSIIRDKTTSPTWRVIKNLKDIRNRFLSISNDIQTTIYELKRSIKSAKIYLDDGVDFDPPHYLRKACKTYPSFLELIRQQDKRRMEELIDLESQTSKIITSRGGLTSAIANIRIQRRVFWLTIAIVAFTISSILKIDFSLQKIQEKLVDLIKFLINVLEKI